jgi:hypothetical protein
MNLTSWNSGHLMAPRHLIPSVPQQTFATFKDLCLRLPPGLRLLACPFMKQSLKALV